MQRYQWTISPSLHQKRLDVIIAESWPISRRKAKTIIEEGGVYINNRRVVIVSTLANQGDVITCYYDESLYNAEIPQFDPSWIIHQEEGLWIINKPEGLYSQSTRASLKDNLIFILQKSCSMSYLVPINRLDKLTSGIILLATQKNMARLLSDSFRNHEIHKEYRCLVWGAMQEKLYTIHRPIEPIPNRIPKMYRVAMDPVKGKESLTICEPLNILLKHEQVQTLVKAIPKTGRTHQIRVHLSSIGYPIVGDSVYGNSDKSPRMMLHAYKTSFMHPITKKQVMVEAPLPPQFLQP